MSFNFSKLSSNWVEMIYTDPNGPKNNFTTTGRAQNSESAISTPNYPLFLMYIIYINITVNSCQYCTSILYVQMKQSL